MPTWPRGTLACLCPAVLITAACTAASTAASPADACPVTHPTETAVPRGVSEQRYGPVFGQGALWVGAWWTDQQTLDWVRAQRPHGMKYPSFTLRDGEVTSALGAPDVRVERLDGVGHGSGSTGGYATATQDGSGKAIHWWPTGVTFSGTGCWQVTETVADTRLVYVVKV